MEKESSYIEPKNYSESKRFGIKKETPSIEVVRDNPEEILSEDFEISPEDKIIIHNQNREVISNKEKFLGIGTSGFVVIRMEEGQGSCSKFIWQRLRVNPNKGTSIEDLRNYGEDIKKLYEIEREFERQKEANRREAGDREILPTNSPIKEMAIQTLVERSFKDKKINCGIPRIISLFRHEEKEEDYNEYSYYLDECYTEISMEQIRGKSLQDLILEYPTTKNLMEKIDFQKFYEDLIKGFEEMHNIGVRHRDVTLRNIMFDEQNLRPVIIDFGKSEIGVTSGSDSDSEEEEMKKVASILNSLQDALRDPEKKKKELLESIKKRDLRAGFIVD